MYWPLEGSVTSTESTAVSSGKDIGNNCIVTIKDENLEGRIGAKGTKTCRTLYGLSIQTATKSEMQKLEDNFVAGSWIPSFLQNPEPKQQKRKRNNNKNKGQKKTKEKQQHKKTSRGYDLHLGNKCNYMGCC